MGTGTYRSGTLVQEIYSGKYILRCIYLCTSVFLNMGNTNTKAMTSIKTRFQNTWNDFQGKKSGLLFLHFHLRLILGSSNNVPVILFLLLMFLLFFCYFAVNGTFSFINIQITFIKIGFL